MNNVLWGKNHKFQAEAGLLPSQLVSCLTIQNNFNYSV